MYGHLYHAIFMTLRIITHANNFHCFDAWKDSHCIKESPRPELGLTERHFD